MSHPTQLPFATLDPSKVVRAIESLGFWLGSEPFALNSYENRVYSFRDDDGEKWIAKFYRPERWSDETILSEHHLLTVLAEANVAVGDVWRNDQGQSLFHFEDQRLSVFPHVSGRPPELEDPSQLFALGQTIGRMHLAAECLELPHRLHFDAVSICRESRRVVLDSQRLTSRAAQDYSKVTSQLIATIESLVLPQVRSIIVHGDCHIGNILGFDEKFTLVDFDDCGYAPAIQDLWMLLSDNNDQVWHAQLAELIEGYEEFREFDRREIKWIELLRTVRLMKHSAWVLKRWDDPAFPQAFPWIESAEYWLDHARELDAQRVRLGEPFWLA